MSEYERRADEELATELQNELRRLEAERLRAVEKRDRANVIVDTGEKNRPPFRKPLDRSPRGRLQRLARIFPIQQYSLETLASPRAILLLVALFIMILIGVSVAHPAVELIESYVARIWDLVF